MKKLNSQSKHLVIITVLTAVLLTLSAVAIAFAWFPGELGTSDDTLLIYSGDLNLNVNVCKGVDINQDGVLDNAADEDGNAVRASAVYDPATDTTLPKSDRDKITTYMYSEIDSVAGASYEEYIEGSSIILKIVAENPSSNVSPAKVSVKFSDLGSYFFGNETALANADKTAINAVMDEYSARIMFKLADVTARVYTNSTEGTVGFTGGYNSLARSSIAAEATGNVTAISTVNAYSKTSFYLSEVSSGEYFIEGVTLNPGELAEFDFKLTCLATDEIYTSYEAYWESYITAHPSLSATERQYIRDMYLSELAYIVSDDTDNVLSLQFTIGKIYIFGEQTERPKGGANEQG